MKRPPKKPKCTDELAYQVQYVGKPRGWTDRYQAVKFGVSTATIRRAKVMPVSRETMARHAAPPKAAPAPVAPVQAAETDEPIVEWLADLLAAEVKDGGDVVFAQLPAMLVGCLTDPEHVRSVLATLALVATDDGDDDDTREAHIARARALLADAAEELETVHATHFADDQEPVQ